MTIGFGTNFLESIRTATTDPWTFAYTPLEALKGVIVAVIHGVSSTDHVVSMTFDGNAMTRINTATDTATEPGRADLWRYFADIPVATATISADLASATTDDIHFVVIPLTGAANLEVVDSDLINENATNPSRTLQYGGRMCAAVAALYGGGAAPTSFTENANCTRVHDHDLGAFYAVVLRQTTPGTADFAIGGTAAADDVAYVAAAISEVVVAFDAALMASMTRPWRDIVFRKPEVVASGSAPPDFLPP